jgi:transposase InsO family protein
LLEKGLKGAVQQFVHNCHICIQAKADRSTYPGKLQPLSIPIEAWELVTMDFIEGLPKFAGANCILVVVDKFARFGHFIALAHPYTAHSMASAFLNTIYRFHGLPTSIVSDRDPVFTSWFWQSLFKLAVITLNLSSAYHPHNDGQIERVNQFLETFLRCFVPACPKKWKEWLCTAEFWYNNCFHSALRHSPFEALYGRQPRTLGIAPPAGAKG